MPRLEILPHRTASASAWRRGAWSVAVGDAPSVPVTGAIEGWDYDNVLTFHSETVVDMELIHEACETVPGAVFELLSVWDCQATGTRAVGDRTVLSGTGEQAAVSEFTIPGRTLAERVKIERQVVLMEAGGEVAPFSPSAPGSIVLWENAREVVSITLEGTGGRFPVEAIDFPAQRRPDGAWWLDITYTDPDDSFLGAVRLYLNERHPAIKHLLAEPGSEEASRTLSVIQWDASRRLLMEVAGDERMVHGPFEEGSVGDVIARMCSSILQKDAGAVFAMSRSDRDRFELSLQEAFRLLRE